MRRLARIVPLYWAVLTVILINIWLGWVDILAAAVPVSGRIASFLFLPYPRPDGTMLPLYAIGWTLNYEMFFYAMFAGAIALSRRPAVVVISGLFIVVVAFGRTLHLPEPFAFWAKPIILEFCFGMLIALAYRENIRISQGAGAALIVIALGGFAASLLVTGKLEAPVLQWGLPATALVAAAALMEPAPSIGPLGRALAFLGEASYSLYLIHPFGLALPRLLGIAWPDPAASPWLYAGLGLALAIVLGVLVHLAFEAPVTRALQRWIPKAERGPATPQPSSALPGR